MVICDSRIEEMGNTAPAGQSPAVRRHNYTRHVDDFHLINTTFFYRSGSGNTAFPCDNMRRYESPCKGHARS